MKKKLRISLGLTVFMMLLMWISDLLFHTKFMGAAVFQPFPHLIFFLLLGLDLYFWYKLREEKRKQLPKYGKKNIVDYFILFLLADLALSSDKERISSATTANPLPCSPALAASIDAFRDKRLVCEAMELISPRIVVILFISVSSESVA